MSTNLSLPKIKLISSYQDLKQACTSLSSMPVVGYDIETTDLDPYLGKIRLLQLSDGATSYVIDLWSYSESLTPLEELLTGPVTKAIHNALFDCKWTKHHLGIEVSNIFDTMLNSQILACGKGDRAHNLKAVAEYFLGIEVDKSQQVSDWSLPTLDIEQVQYAAKDAAILIDLYHEQVKRLTELSLLEVSRLENECVPAIVDMELTGIYLDGAAWRDHLENVEAQRKRLDDELQRELLDPNGLLSLFGRADINLGSTTQVQDAFKALGIPCGDSLEAWKIEALAVQYPVVSKYLDWKATDKVMSSFGDNILNMIHPVTGKLHPSVRQLGAITTGRFSMSEPNFQQWPKDEISRGSVKAGPGKKLVIADYSQIELRILADRSQDSVFVEAFRSGADFHLQTAAAINNIAPEDVTDEQRDFAKRLNFGIVYGVGYKKFATLNKIPEAQAESFMRSYFERLPGLNMYLREEGRRALCLRESRTAAGRLLNLHYNEDYRGEVGSAKRNGVNQPIQGTSADILKRALALLHHAMKGTSGHLVNIVHDEILTECDAHEAELIAEKLTACMIAAGEEYVKSVPIVVDPVITDLWRKK